MLVMDSPARTRSRMASHPPRCLTCTSKARLNGCEAIPGTLLSRSETMGQTVGLRLVFARVRLSYSGSLVLRAGQADTRWREGDRAGASPARHHNPRVVGSSPTAAIRAGPGPRWGCPRHVASLLVVLRARRLTSPPRRVVPLSRYPGVAGRAGPPGSGARREITRGPRLPVHGS